MQPLYVALLLFVVLWGVVFKSLSWYAGRMAACTGKVGKFLWTTLVSLLSVVAVFLLTELFPRLYGGLTDLL